MGFRGIANLSYRFCFSFQIGGALIKEDGKNKCFIPKKTSQSGMLRPLMERHSFNYTLSILDNYIYIYFNLIERNKI